MVLVHYGHLCTVRVVKFDTSVGHDGGSIANVTFQVSANKTRATRTYPVRVAMASEDDETMDVVRRAWKMLTGHDISGTGQSGDQSPGQTSVLNEIKEFVKRETSRLSSGATIDVV